MNRLNVSILISALIAFAPNASAHEAQSALTLEQVRDTFQHRGFDTDEPIFWESSVLTTFFVRDGPLYDRLVLVLVYADAQAAEQEHAAAHAQEEAELGLPLTVDDDQGPQLVPGYGRSAWWHNVALVQASLPGRLLTNELTPPEQIRTARSRIQELKTLQAVDRDFVDVLRSIAASPVAQRF
ncbi:MAG TPA: hypothetical protein VGL99_34360 [Chloroflexota bacterium]